MLGSAEGCRDFFKGQVYEHGRDFTSCGSVFTMMFHDCLGAFEGDRWVKAREEFDRYFGATAVANNAVYIQEKIDIWLDQVCGAWRVACGVWRVACGLSRFACRVSCVLCRVSCVVCRVSCVVCRVTWRATTAPTLRSKRSPTLRCVCVCVTGCTDAAAIHPRHQRLRHHPAAGAQPVRVARLT